MRRLLCLLIVAVLGWAGVTDATPAAAQPLPKHCLPTATSGPTCTWTKARVTYIADGDTFDVHDLITGSSYRVRNNGINTLEMAVHSRYRERRAGICHSVEATNRFEDLVRAAGGVVYLAAQDVRSTSQGRYLRSVWTNVGGRWRDLSLTLLEEGRALWMPSPVEWAHREYGYHAQRAAAAGVGIWDRDGCRTGPAQDRTLTMSVNWDADGPDHEDVNGEWVHLRNESTRDLSLAGWYFRDSYNRQFVFPAGTVVRGGGSVTLHMGRGTNTATTFYWGLSAPVLRNVNVARGQGDGGYLFDPHGDARAWMIYPCAYHCVSPLSAKVDVDAHPSSPEHVDVRNVSDRPVDLRGHLVKSPPYSYHFLNSTPLQPGATLRLHVLGSPAGDTTTTRYWGRSGGFLNDRSDAVALKSYTDTVVGCDRWGASAPQC